MRRLALFIVEFIATFTDKVGGIVVSIGLLLLLSLPFYWGWHWWTGPTWRVLDERGIETDATVSAWRSGEPMGALITSRHGQRRRATAYDWYLSYEVDGEAYGWGWQGTDSVNRDAFRSSSTRVKYLPEDPSRAMTVRDIEEGKHGHEGYVQLCWLVLPLSAAIGLVVGGCQAIKGWLRPEAEEPAGPAAAVPRPPKSSPLPPPPPRTDDGPTPIAADRIRDYEREVGRALLVKITARIDGVIYGVGPYTSDSDPGTSAVHSGVASAGEAGFLSIRIVRPVDVYPGAEQHGVASRPWTSGWPGAYAVEGFIRTGRSESGAEMVQTRPSGRFASPDPVDLGPGAFSGPTPKGSRLGKRRVRPVRRLKRRPSGDD